MTIETKEMTAEQWRAEGRALFGDDMMTWAFVCPSCGHVAKPSDWKAAGAPQNAVAYSCVGRWLGADATHTFHGKGGPCNYAGGGLIGLNPITVLDDGGVVRHVFAFASGVR